VEGEMLVNLAGIKPIKLSLYFHFKTCE